jgi:EAL domain-containing protein (putative c-di-GMP-specific phosphodiesterase class I)
MRPELAHLTLAVNVSAKQFHLSTFVDEVLTLVDYFGIDPTKLKLEITESMMVSNVGDIIDKIAALKARGINFSIDDFGTGYSSLQYLKRLPLDQLKIDRSFVRDIVSDDNDKAIMRTIIAMAHSLNLSVIAEGVETEEQRQLLLSNGCTAYQGYLFGRPAPIDQFESSVAGNLPFFAAISASRSECHRCT